MSCPPGREGKDRSPKKPSSVEDEVFVNPMFLLGVISKKNSGHVLKGWE